MLLVEKHRFYSEEYIRTIVEGEHGKDITTEILESNGHVQEDLIFEQLVLYFVRTLTSNSAESIHQIEVKAGEILDEIKGPFIDALKNYKPRYSRSFIYTHNSYPFYITTFYNN